MSVSSAKDMIGADAVPLVSINRPETYTSDSSLMVFPAKVMSADLNGPIGEE